MEIQSPHHQYLYNDLTDMPPPLECDGQNILTMSWPRQECCYECNDNNGELFHKRVLWHMTDELLIYINLPVCLTCWPNIGWEAWTISDATPEDMNIYLEWLWNTAK